MMRQLGFLGLKGEMLQVQAIEEEREREREDMIFFLCIEPDLYDFK